MADGALFLGRMLMPVGTPANILGARPVVMKGLHHEERHECQEQHPCHGNPAFSRCFHSMFLRHVANIELLSGSLVTYYLNILYHFANMPNGEPTGSSGFRFPIANASQNT